jgi:hypothetical protein
MDGHGGAKQSPTQVYGSILSLFTSLGEHDIADAL